MISILGTVAPRLTDRVMEWTMFSGQRTGQPATHGKGSLYGPGDAAELRARGGHDGHVRQFSVHDLVTRHPVAAASAALILGSIIGSVWFASDAQRRERARCATRGLARSTRAALGRIPYRR